MHGVYLQYLCQYVTEHKYVFIDALTRHIVQAMSKTINANDVITHLDRLELQTKWNMLWGRLLWNKKERERNKKYTNYTISMQFLLLFCCCFVSCQVGRNCNNLFKTFFSLEKDLTLTCFFVLRECLLKKTHRKTKQKVQKD